MGIDDDFAARGFTNTGACIMGRNMFGPVRGPWPDDSRKGWWGDNPPYHAPVFVLTSHPPHRSSWTAAPLTTSSPRVFTLHSNAPPKLPMANGKDIQLMGGASTIRQYLRAGLIDEMHFAIAPILLGSGEHLLAGIDAPKIGYQCTQHVTTANATHVVLTKGS